MKMYPNLTEVSVTFSAPDLLTHVHRLSTAIGPRPQGSPANQAAADYIQAVFQAAGLEVEEQPYACTAWEHFETRLTLAGRPLEAAANVFSLPCDLTGLCVPVCSLAELEQAEITGKFVLFYGDLTTGPLSPKAWFLFGERDRQILDLLERKRPLALLAAPVTTVEVEQLTEDWEFDLPAASLSAAAALEVIRNPAASLHLTIQAQRSPATARNLVARRPGPGAEKIVLMAHFDTKIETPGATDNAAGVAVLLGLAQTLVETELPCGLELVAFSGEEYLPLGDDEYLRRGEADFPHIRVALNFDGVGAALGTTTLTALSASAEFEAQVKSLLPRHLGVIWVDPWPESNHSTFAFRGVPALAFGSVGLRHLAHSPLDTTEQVSEAKLAETLRLALEILELFRES